MTALHNHTLETGRSRFLCQSSKCTVEKIMASFYLCAIVMSLFINWGGKKGWVGVERERKEGMHIHQAPNPDTGQSPGPLRAPDLFINVCPHTGWNSSSVQHTAMNVPIETQRIQRFLQDPQVATTASVFLSLLCHLTSGPFYCWVKTKEILERTPSPQQEAAPPPRQ